MADYSEIVAKIKPSIAFISVMVNGKFKAYGSGFVFNKPGILVTCNHVVQEPYDKIFISFPGMLFGEFLEGKVTNRNLKADVAIVEFADPDQRPPLEINTKDVREGNPVLFLGYPLGLKTLTTHHGILSSIMKDATGNETYLIDGSVNVGNSGCPLITEDGFVIGVVSATKREDADLLGAIGEMKTGVIALHGIDMVEIYQALIKNLQLGIGFAVPCAYIPK